MATQKKIEPQDDRETWLDREVRPALLGRAMTTAVEDLSTSEAADSWQMLDLLKESIEDRLKELRELLMSAAERDGRPTEKGGQQILLNGAKIERQRRQASEPDRDKILALLAQRKIETSDVYDEVKALVYNPSKIQFLIDTGKLSEEEVEAHKAITFALRVYKADDWIGLFEEAAKKKARKKGIPQARAAH